MPWRRAWSLFTAAVLLRLAVAAGGPPHWLAYSLYLQMAENAARGVGFCLYPNGTYCAYFPPVYPALLVPGVWLGQSHWGVVLTGITAGALSCVLLYLLGRTLFSESAGLAAAGYAVVYPYYLWHDGVLQETAVLTCVVLAAMYALVRAARGAGVLLGAAVLTKATLGLFAVLAVVWAVWRKQGWLVLGGFVLVVGGWMLRTSLVTGSPVLYSNTGFAWWTIHQPRAFDVFPQRSIDEVTLAQWGDLNLTERREFDSLEDAHGLARSSWLWRKGWADIRHDPARAAWQAVEKVWIAFSPVFSPAKGRLFQWLYALFYLPLLLLAPVGMWRSRARWRELAPLYLVIAAFAVSCALFWGHTSHRMYVEPYLMLFASTVLWPFRGASGIHSGIVWKFAL